jgi:hypothetical protein
LEKRTERGLPRSIIPFILNPNNGRTVMDSVNYLKFDLGKLKSDKIVEVILSGDATNVRLLDQSNMYSYVHGHDFQCLGGLVTKSPVRLSIPRDDHWYVIIDMKGLEGTLPKASETHVKVH